MTRLIVLLGVLAVAAAWAEDAPRTYEVAAARVSVFAEPAPYFGIVGKARKGEVLPVLGEDGRWLKVRLADGTEGWLLPSSGASTSGGGEKVVGTAAAAEAGVGLVTKGFAEGYVKKNGADPAAAARIEKPLFTRAEYEAFLREGGLRRPR